MSRSPTNQITTSERTSAPELDALRDDLGLSAQELASALGVSARTLERWRMGGFSMSRNESGQRLAHLVQLRDRIFESVREDAVPEWLSTRRRYLGDLTPIEVIRAGRPDRVMDLLTAIDHGLYV